MVNSAMIRGIRLVSIDQGYDPRDFCLVAFGGAGPVHASELAAELSVPRVLVPNAPGVTSALGLLMADVRYDFVRTVLRAINDVRLDHLQSLFTEMETQAVAHMASEGISHDALALSRTADTRYLGQGFELQVQVRAGELSTAAIDDLIRDFHDAHRERYGYAATDHVVEIVNLRVTALASLPKPMTDAEPLDSQTDPRPAHTSVRSVVFNGAYSDASIYDRSFLRPGDVINGPAVIEQLDATTVVWPGQRASVDGHGNLLLEPDEK